MASVQMRTLAQLTYTRSWWVLGAALVISALAAVAAMQIFDRVDPFDIADPGSEVERATAAVEEATSRSPTPEVALLVTAEGGYEPSEAASAAKRLRSVTGIAKVTTPETDPALTADSGESFLVVGYLAPGIDRVDVGEAAVDKFASDPSVTTGGTAVAAFQVGLRSEHDTRRLEIYAAPVLLLMLLIVFRTVVAAVLPLIVAGLSILLAFAGLRLLTSVTAIDLFSLQTVTGLGTGLAINYSLFILARYREELSEHGSFREAHLNTLLRAGRTVMFSSITVAAALASLLVFPQPFLHSTGIAGALVAIFAGLIALIVLPAGLALLGPSVNRLAVRRDPLRSKVTDPSSFWRRVPTAVCRRPVPALVIGTAVMVALALQVGGTSFTTPDARELPAQDSARQVAESVATDFSGIPQTRLFAVLPDSASNGAPRADLAEVPGLTQVSQSKQLGNESELITISGDMDPFSENGQEFLSNVRDRLPPGSLVGGRAAEQADQRSSVLDVAPIALGLIIVVNLLLLGVMTRAILLPLLALAVNLVTVVASLGVLTTVFTSDAATEILGTEVPPGIDISVPVISFAITFGLSTDYGIFLFARIREERERAPSETAAIVAAVSATGRLITASAALMTIAVGAFIFSDLVIVKEFAIAIAVAVVLDATVIRGLVIPASLRLLGRWAWWPWQRSSRAG